MKAIKILILLFIILSFNFITLSGAKEWEFDYAVEVGNVKSYETTKAYFLVPADAENWMRLENESVYKYLSEVGLIQKYTVTNIDRSSPNDKQVFCKKTVNDFTGKEGFCHHLSETNSDKEYWELKAESEYSGNGITRSGRLNGNIYESSKEIEDFPWMGQVWLRVEHININTGWLEYMYTKIIYSNGTVLIEYEAKSNDLTENTGGFEFLTLISVLIVLSFVLRKK